MKDFVMTNQQKDLIDSLAKHPHIEARIIEPFNSVENNPGEFGTADAAEKFLIKAIRQEAKKTLPG